MLSYAEDLKLTTIDLAFIFEEILNDALVEDTLDDGRVSLLAWFLSNSKLIPYRYSAFQYTSSRAVQIRSHLDNARWY